MQGLGWGRSPGREWVAPSGSRAALHDAARPSVANPDVGLSVSINMAMVRTRLHTRPVSGPANIGLR